MALEAPCFSLEMLLLLFMVIWWCFILIRPLILQVLGASWYLLSIERHATCWKSACKHELSPIPCKPRYLDCGTLNFADRKSWENTTVLFSRCNPSDDTFFDYGIFANALEQNVLSSDFLEKYFYCLWWGLQNLRYKCSFKIMIASDCILSFSLAL